MFQQFINQSHEDEINSIRPNSLNTYKSYLESYAKKMKTIDGAPEPFPLNEEKIRGFIVYIKDNMQPSATLNTIKLYVAAFSYHFNENGFNDETKNTNFKKFIKSIRLKMTEDPPNRKHPITKEMISKIAETINIKDQESVRFMTTMSLMYYGFLRLSEVSNLTIGDINLDDAGLH